MRPGSPALASGALALAAAITLTACSSTSDKKTSGPSSGTAALSPAQRLAAAKRTVDATSGVHLKLSSADLPKNLTGITGGEGDGSHAPAFKGTLNGQLGSLQATIPVVAVGGKVWAKLPVWNEMRQIKPADYGAPDPAVLFSSGEGGISTLLVKTQHPSLGNKLRSGQEVVQQIKGTLPGAVVVKTLAIGKTSETYDVIYDLTDDDRVVNVALDGVFSGSTKSSYGLALSNYGQRVDVKAP